MKKMATIHPIIIHYMIPDKPGIYHKSFIHLSPVDRHNGTMVFAMMKLFYKRNLLPIVKSVFGDHDDQEDDEDFEISLSQKFERENTKNDSSENDVDGDPLYVLTLKYITTMMEHCFIMYNRDVYLVQALKLCGHFEMDVRFYKAWGCGMYTRFKFEEGKAVARVPMSYHICTVNTPQPLPRSRFKLTKEELAYFLSIRN